MKRLAGILAALIFWVALWQLIYMIIGRDVVLSSPAQVAGRLGVLAAAPFFWKTVLTSISRVFLGYFLGVLGGTIIAVLTSVSAAARVILKPALTVIRATPVASFVLLALIFLSSGPVPVLMSFLMVLPIIWSGVSTGISSADGQLLEMARAFRLPLFKRLRAIYIPAVIPGFAAACETSIGLAWKSAIAAEVLGTPPFSIGSNIYSAKIYLETADLFAWTVVVVLLSLMFEKLFSRLIKRLRAERAVQNDKS